MEPSGHFEGKSALEHLKAARKKGALISAEIHGVEISGSLSAFADSLKEASLLLLLIYLFFYALLPTHFLLALTLIGVTWIVWKTVRSALLGYARIERLNRLIEEERWEIEHHREQEKEELTEMYQAKGLSGRLLEETVEVLMADDNRLLQIMLEEELGLSLETYEHPLRQACGALIGTLLALALTLFGFWLAPSVGPFIATLLAFCLSCSIQARAEKNQVFPFLIWNLSSAILATGTLYLLMQILVKQ